jgi:hypothetical protein
LSSLASRATPARRDEFVQGAQKFADRDPRPHDARAVVWRDGSLGTDRIRFRGSTALVLFLYVAHGLPMSIFILSEFMQQIPTDLRGAAHCDGVPETRIFL